jgi:signal transduction histidine kinase
MNWNGSLIPSLTIWRRPSLPSRGSWGSWGFLRFLEKDLTAGDQERVYSDVKRVNEAVDKMNQLLKELLELSRIGRMMNESDDIRFTDLVNDALDLVHGGLESRRVTVRILSRRSFNQICPLSMEIVSV